jgi:hypothetical protein
MLYIATKVKMGGALAAVTGVAADGRAGCLSCRYPAANVVVTPRTAGLRRTASRRLLETTRGIPPYKTRWQYQQARLKMGMLCHDT